MIPTWNGSGDPWVFVHLALGSRPNCPTGSSLLSQYPGGAHHAWHAPNCWNSRTDGWARLNVVGCQKVRSRAHCCHFLPVFLSALNVLCMEVVLSCVRDTLGMLS